MSDIATALLLLASICISAALKGRGMYEFLDHWQTLIGSFMTIGAAAVALIPVWRQLNRMELQTEAMLREPHVARIRDAEWSLLHTDEALREFLRSAARDLNQFEVGEDIEISPGAAFHWHNELSANLSTFSQLAAARLDVQRIEDSKSAAVLAAEDLKCALDDISVPDRFDRDEIEISDADWQNILSKASEAEQEVPRLMFALRSRLEELKNERFAELTTLRAKLRTIDDRLSAG